MHTRQNVISVTFFRCAALLLFVSPLARAETPHEVAGASSKATTQPSAEAPAEERQIDEKAAKKEIEEKFTAFAKTKGIDAAKLNKHERIQLLFEFLKQDKSLSTDAQIQLLFDFGLAWELGDDDNFSKEDWMVVKSIIRQLGNRLGMDPKEIEKNLAANTH